MERDVDRIGERIERPWGAWTVHRLENPDSGPLVVIEVQNGNDLCEAAIVRLEDNFGRPGTYDPVEIAMTGTPTEV